MYKKLIAAIMTAAVLGSMAFGVYAQEIKGTEEGAAETADLRRKTETAEDDTAMIVGGWAMPDKGIELTDEAKAAFEKAMEGLTGADYEPLALLGTQVVAGTNYCVLCRATVVYPGAMPGYSLVYIYEDLEGNAEILGISDMEIGNYVQEEMTE